jgi:DNA-binding NtrC family response regulator
MSFQLKSPLRERKEDIPFLIDYFTSEFFKEYKVEKKLSTEAVHEIIKLPWKGNIRELRNFVERLLIISNNDEINKNDVMSLVSQTPQEKLPINIYLKDNFDLYETLDSVENQILKLASKKYKTTTEMASALGVNQSTISKKLRKYNISLKDINGNS